MAARRPAAPAPMTSTLAVWLLTSTFISSQVEGGEHVLHGGLGHGDEPRIRLRVVGDHEQGLMEGEAAGPGPGSFVDFEGGAKTLPPACAEHAPCRDDVGRRVAYANTTEVDDRFDASSG